MLIQPDLVKPIQEALTETGNPSLMQAQTIRDALISYGCNPDFIASQLMEIASQAKYSVRHKAIMDLMAMFGNDFRRSEGDVATTPQINIMIMDSNVQLNGMFNPDREIKISEELSA